jgi:hypothetical protein
VTNVHHSKLLQALTIAAVFAALTTTTAALAGTRASGHATPDSFERYASAHPYGSGVASVNSTPDVFERYAVAHALTAFTDRRSPDTRSIADARQLTLSDKRSPDTLDTATGSRTALAAAIIPPTDLGQRGSFDWGDAGIGAAAAILILGTLAGLLLLLPPRPQRRQPAQTT